MLGPDRRFRDPNPEEIAALDLEGMRTAVMRQVHAGNVEVRGRGRGVAPGVSRGEHWVGQGGQGCRSMPTWLRGTRGPPGSAAAARPQQEAPLPCPSSVLLECLHELLDSALTPLHPAAAQVSVVGDFDPAELEACVLKYLGTVSPEPKVPLPEDPAQRLGRPLQILGGMPLEERHMTWHLKDSGGCPLDRRADGGKGGLWQL